MTTLITGRAYAQESAVPTVIAPAPTASAPTPTPVAPESPSAPYAAPYAGPVPMDSQGRPWPRTLPYHEGYAVPNGYHAETRIRTALAIVGGSVFGAFYGMSVYAQANSNESGWLYVPVLGPFIAAGQVKSCHNCWIDLSGLAVALLVFDGLAQTAGVGMFVGGVGTTKTVLVRNDVVKIRVLPVASDTRAGVLVAMTF